MKNNCNSPENVPFVDSFVYDPYYCGDATIKGGMLKSEGLINKSVNRNVNMFNIGAVNRNVNSYFDELYYANAMKGNNFGINYKSNYGGYPKRGDAYMAKMNQFSHYNASNTIFNGLPNNNVPSLNIGNTIFNGSANCMGPNVMINGLSNNLPPPINVSPTLKESAPIEENPKKKENIPANLVNLWILIM